jgi:hypothetical protein
MIMYRSRKAFTILLSVCVAISANSLVRLDSFAATPIYTYTDDAGVQNFTNQLESIPEQYRDQIPRQDYESSLYVPASPRGGQPSVSSAVKTVMASAEYRMTDHDSRADAVRLAVEAAKKDALERVATYLESVTEVRNLDVTRDDIRSYTAGVVKVLDQTVTTRLEDDQVVIRADIKAEVDPREVVQAIAALRENESAKQELTALRAETDRLQAQLDETSRALAASPSPEEVQQLSRQRDDLLNDIQANGLMSQAWTSWAYPTVVYSSPWIGGPGIAGLLLQAQRLSPHHRHLPLAQQTITAQPPATQSQPDFSPPSRQSLLVPSPAPMHGHQAPPLLNTQGQPARVGDVVVMPTPRSVPPPMIQHSIPSSPQPQQYQLHPNHFWRPSPPNIPAGPPFPSAGASISPQRYSGGHHHSNHQSLGMSRSSAGFSHGGSHGGGSHSGGSGSGHGR